MKFSEIDVSTWRLVYDEPLGTKPKRWLEHPETGAHWLMKDVTFNKRRDGTSYAKGDDWAERVACAIAQTLGLSVASVELATRHSLDEVTLGVISRSVLPREEDEREENLVHGNELLEEVGVAGAHSRDRTGYTVSAVREALLPVAPPDDGSESSWHAFVGYLVLDALIGNTDRHQENWAAIASGANRRLSPTFDHASCLGFQLDDEQRSERLVTNDNNRTPEAYAERAKSRFDGSPTPFAVAVEALDSLAERDRQVWLERCAEVDSLVEPLGSVSDSRMSEPSREFAERVLRSNHGRLMSHLSDTV